MLVDVARDDNGDLALNARYESYLIYGRDAIAQSIRGNLAFFKGEWFLDQREGTPWYQSILGIKGVSLDTLASVFRQVLLSSQGVVSVSFCRVEWTDRPARKAQVVWEVESDEGTLVSSDWPPFIVTTPEIL